MKAFILTCILIFFTACTKEPKLFLTVDTNKGYYDLLSASDLDLEAMAQRLKYYRIIFIGDHHDEKNLYIKIASLIKELSLTKKVHLASEWFTPSDDKTLNAYINQDINKTTLKQKLSWDKNIGYEFEMLDVMYQEVRKSKGKLYGINLSKQERQRISKKDFITMDRKEKAFFDALDLNVSAHVNMLKPYFKDCHAYSDKNCSERMYRVQVAWDTKMAESSYNILENLGKDEVLIVLVGSMHLEKKVGINLRFSRLNAVPSYTLLPHVYSEKVLELGSSDGAIFYKEKVNQTK